MEKINFKKHDWFALGGIIFAVIFHFAGADPFWQGLAWSFFLIGILGSAMEQVEIHKVQNITAKTVEMKGDIAPPQQKALRRLQWAYEAFQNQNLNTLQHVKEELEGMDLNHEAYDIALDIVNSYIRQVKNLKTEKAND